MTEQQTLIEHVEMMINDLKELIECKKFISSILPLWMSDEKVKLYLEIGALELRVQALIYELSKLSKAVNHD